MVTSIYLLSIFRLKSGPGYARLTCLQVEGEAEAPVAPVLLEQDEMLTALQHLLPGRDIPTLLLRLDEGDPLQISADAALLSSLLARLRRRLPLGDACC